MGIAAQVGLKKGGRCLEMVFRFRHDYIVDENTRYFHPPAIKATSLGDVSYLGYYHAATVFDGCGEGHRFEVQRLMSHHHVALFIRGCAADDGHIDGKGLVIEIFFPIKFDKSHQFIFGNLRYPATLQARVNICAQAHLGDYTYFLAGHIPPQMCHDALGKEMGFYFIFADQFSQTWSLADMAGDYLSYKTLMAEMVHPFDIAVRIVAAATTVGEGEKTGSPRFQKTFFNGHRHFFGKAAHAGRRPGYRHPVLDQLRHVLRAYYFGYHFYLLSCHVGNFIDPAEP